MNIYLTGAHGTGKTTIANNMTDYEQTPSVARESPYESGTAENQNYLMEKIYDDCTTLDGYCFTRTPIDVAAYTYLYLSHVSKEVANAEATLIKFRDTNPLIFYTPIEFELEEDGVRPGAEEQEIVDIRIKNFLRSYGFNYVTVTGTVEQRVDLIKESINAKI